MHDNADLFADSGQLESIPLADADLRFARTWLAADAAQALFAQLLEQTPWRQEQVRVWGQVHAQPRLTAWYGDPHCAYAYSELALQPLPWTPLLSALREQITAISGADYNCVLLNLYRNEKDSVGWHADDEAELGPQPAIASLSLGATRIFKMKHKRHPHVSPLTLALNSGSLLLMAGATQQNWQHAVLKQSHPCAARINLTFRHIQIEKKHSGDKIQG